MHVILWGKRGWECWDSNNTPEGMQHLSVLLLGEDPFVLLGLEHLMKQRIGANLYSHPELATFPGRVSVAAWLRSWCQAEQTHPSIPR